MRKFSKMLTVGLAAALVFGMNVNAQELKNPSIAANSPISGVTADKDVKFVATDKGIQENVTEEVWNKFDNAVETGKVIGDTEVVTVVEKFKIDPPADMKGGEKVTLTFPSLSDSLLRAGEKFVVYRYANNGTFKAVEEMTKVDGVWTLTLDDFSLCTIAVARDYVPEPVNPGNNEVYGWSNWGGDMKTDEASMKAGMTEEAWTIFKSNKPLLGFDVNEKQVLWPVPGGEFRMDCPQYWDGSDVTVFFNNMPTLNKDNDESFALYRYDVASGQFVEEVQVYENPYTHRYEATLPNLNDWSLWRLYIVKGSPEPGDHWTYLPDLDNVTVGVAGANSTPTGVAATATNGTPVSPKTGETLPVAGMVAVLCLAGAVVCAKKVRCNG